MIYIYELKKNIISLLKKMRYLYCQQITNIILYAMNLFANL